MSTIVIDKVSRWYGNVVAVNDVTMQIGPGITGLLGPNGAGKSTLISMMAGFLPASSGTVTIDGEATWRNQAIYARVGLVPEREGMYEVVSGWDLVLSNARLYKLPDPERAARQAIETVDMTAAQDRGIATYSKGMKQRIKVATALVHDPAVLLLDEPFNGMDPRQRVHLMDLLHRMGEAGRSVLFSSHILEEVEQLAGSIEVMVAGRHAASGNFREIRRLMTEKPHQYTIRSTDNRRLASVLVADVSTSAVQLVGAPAGPGAAAGNGIGDGGSLHVEAVDVARFVKALPWLAQQTGVRLLEVSPTDESLESVFSYLVNRS